MTTDIDLSMLKEVKPDHPCELDVHVHLEGEKKGYIVRKRWKTFKEVYDAMHAELNVSVCSKCKTEKPYSRELWDNPCKCEEGAEWQQIIDEYDSGRDYPKEEYEQPIASMDEELVYAIAHCCEGGNEGYQAHLSCIFRPKYGGGFGSDGNRYVHLYWIKSFVGHDHVHDLTRRMNHAVGNFWNGGASGK